VLPLVIMKISPCYVARLLAATADDAVGALAQLSSFWSARARLTEAGELTGLSRSERARASYAMVLR
jgi:hypothetical protein